jgi:hypothetical protein
LSFVSQTPLWQTSVAAAAVHVPFRVGFACGGSDGTTVPFDNCGRHADMLSSHHCPVAQSASVTQPPGGMQVLFRPHAPERHTVPPFAIVHGPSPFA